MRRGGRRCDSSRDRSITSESGALLQIGPARNNPTPRASIKGGGVSGRCNCARSGSTQTPSSEISSAPRAMRDNASEDFPLPEGPRIRAPLPATTIADAWKKSLVPSRALARSASGSAGGVMAQIGRPTTNLAPRGSDVTSASVGRMFSAQMTPPWASTICLEIARPRPELLPN